MKDLGNFRNVPEYERFYYSSKKVCNKQKYTKYIYLQDSKIILRLLFKIKVYTNYPS